VTKRLKGNSFVCCWNSAHLNSFRDDINLRIVGSSSQLSICREKADMCNTGNIPVRMSSERK
jgi:hypothetical protein